MPTNIATLVARVVADTSGFNKGMAGVESRIGAVGVAAQRTGRSLTHELTLPILLIAGEAAHMSIEFQKQMTLIQTQAGASAREVSVMGAAVKDLAPATAFGPVELAKALYHIESVGDRGAKALNVLKVAAQGAAVGHANLEDTASALAGTMRVYHVEASGAAGVMGQLNAVVGAGNMRMQDLNKAIGTGLLPTASALGLNIAEVGAALGVMTDESTTAQVASTRLRTLFLMMTGETKKSVDTLNALGIKQGELATLMHQPGGMIPALQDLRDHLHKLSDVDATRTLAMAFGGSRSAGTIIQLLNNLDFVQKKFKQINDTAANFPKAVLETQATDAYKLHNAWAAVQTVLVQVGGIIAPIIVDLAVLVSKAVQAFGGLSEHMQKIIVYGALIVAAIGPVVWIFGTVITAIEALGAVLAALLSPVGLVVAAIAGIAAAFIIAYQRSAAFRDAVKGVWDEMLAQAQALQAGLMNIWNALTQTFQGMGPNWHAVAEDLAQAFDVIHNAVKVVGTFVTGVMNEIATAIHSHSAEIRAGVTAAWNDIQAVTRVVWPVLVTIIKATWDNIKTIIEGAIRIIGDVILIALDLLSGNWSKAWTHLKDIVVTLFKTIGTLLATTMRAWWDVFGPIITALLDKIVNGLKKLGSMIKGTVLDPVVRAFEAAWNAVYEKTLAAVLKIVEPFSHLPGAAGHWARVTKDAIQDQLGQIKTDKFVSNIEEQLKGAGVKASLAHVIAVQAGIKGGTPQIAQAATASGKAIEAATKAGAKLTPKAIGDIILDVANAITTHQGAARGNATALGAAVKEGVLAGVAGLAGALSAEVASAVSNAIAAGKAAASVHSPSEKTRKEIGAPLMEGIILGIQEASPAMQKTFADSLNYLIERGKKAVEDAKGNFSAAFSQLSDDALAAFDAVTNAWVPPAQKLLDKIVAAHDAAELRQRLRDAEQAVKDSARAIVQAQNDMRRGVEKATKDMADSIKQINKDAAANIVQIHKDEADKIAQIQKDMAEKVKGIQKDLNDSLLSTAQSAADRRFDTLQNSADKVTDLNQKYADDVADINAQVAAGTKSREDADAEIATKQRDLNEEIARNARDTAEALKGIARDQKEAIAAAKKKEHDDTLAAAKQEHDDLIAAKKDAHDKEIASEKDRSGKVAAARKDGAAAIKSAEEQGHQAIMAAKKQHNDAEVALDRERNAQEFAAREKHLTAMAAAQSKEYLAERALERRHFAAELGDLQKHFETVKGLHEQSHKELMKLFEKYGVDMGTAGKNLGEAFARGLSESLTDVQKALEKIGAVIQDYLKTHSPARRGPLSTLDTWFSEFIPTLMSSARKEDLQARLDDLARVRVPLPEGTIALPSPALVPGAQQGAGNGTVVHTEVNIHNPTFLSGDRQAARELAAHLKPELDRQISIPSPVR